MLRVKLLLDRSYSMMDKWKDSIDSINEYVNVLKEQGIQGTVDFYVFDHNQNNYVFNTLYVESPVVPVQSKNVSEAVKTNISIENWVPLTGSEVSPRGGTPLFDAVVEIKELIDTDSEERGIFIIMTDGAENASSKSNKKAAADAIAEVEKRGWEVVFLGASFDVAKDAEAMKLDVSRTLSVSDSMMYTSAMRETATRSALYATTGSSINYTDEDRKTFTTKK